MQNKGTGEEGGTVIASDSQVTRDRFPLQCPRVGDGQGPGFEVDEVHVSNQHF